VGFLVDKSAAAKPAVENVGNNGDGDTNEKEDATPVDSSPAPSAGAAVGHTND
jgi:hypothetical protein